MIVCSLSEVETYGRRAARGAGMPWGLAEEAGKASRWLAERGLPGVELLLRLLTANDGRAYSTMAPVIDGKQWRAAVGELCPICSGAALSDRIDVLARGEEICLDALAFPLLLAPFLDPSRGSQDASYELSWPDVRLSIFADGIALICDKKSGHLSERADEVNVSLSTNRSARPSHHPRISGVETPLSVWRAMDALAKRTYVPASEGSRARGAGAGRTDND